MNLFSCSTVALTAAISLLLMPHSTAQETLSKDDARKELKTIYKEDSAASKKFYKILSEIRKAKNPELMAFNKKLIMSMGPITKAMENHPDLAEIRARRDKAKSDWEQATKAKDAEAVKKAIKERSKASSDLHRAAYKHKDIIPHIKAREDLTDQYDELKKKLVSEKEPGLVKKMEALKKRKAELLKIIRS